MDRICKACGGDYSEAFFAKNSDKRLRLDASNRCRKICIGCEQTKRDSQKQRDRWAAKARDAIRRHAKGFIEKGVIHLAGELTERFGWNAKDLAHDLAHAYENGCPYCRKPFKEMGHGLSDLTIDIIDRAKKPFYATNTKIACATCNREKSTTDPDQWAAKLIDWDRWEARQTKLAGRKFDGPLFDWGR
jgi:hypothetical protein